MKLSRLIADLNQMLETYGEAEVELAYQIPHPLTSRRIAVVAADDGTALIEREIDILKGDLEATDDVHEIGRILGELAAAEKDLLEPHGVTVYIAAGSDNAYLPKSAIVALEDTGRWS